MKSVYEDFISGDTGEQKDDTKFYQFWVHVFLKLFLACRMIKATKVLISVYNTDNGGSVSSKWQKHLSLRQICVKEQKENPETVVVSGFFER